jgi:hypothetical protein
MENQIDMKDLSGVRACPINSKPKSEKEENNARFNFLERKVDELNNIIILLQERVNTLERERHRFSRTPSFLTGDPFIFPPPEDKFI